MIVGPPTSVFLLVTVSIQPVHEQPVHVDPDRSPPVAVRGKFLSLHVKIGNGKAVIFLHGAETARFEGQSV